MSQVQRGRHTNMQQWYNRIKCNKRKLSLKYNLLNIQIATNNSFLKHQFLLSAGSWKLKWRKIPPNIYYHVLETGFNFFHFLLYCLIYKDLTWGPKNCCFLFFYSQCSTEFNLHCVLENVGFGDFLRINKSNNFF